LWFIGGGFPPPFLWGNLSVAENSIQSLVILGGGSAGWMAATLLATRFNGRVSITLVESDTIGIIGVGEATVPWIRKYLEDIQLDEQEFMRSTHATFKLGIDFVDWYRPGTSYFHPFGGFGSQIGKVPFHHLWARLQHLGDITPFERYNIGTHLAKTSRFALPNAAPDTPDGARFNYAFHFDASRFASLLSEIAQKRGVKRIEGKVREVKQHSDLGHIESLHLEDGTQVAGDFFIDCSGFNGLLIEQTLATGYVDWSQWLPCNRALAMPCARSEEIPSYTRSLAQSAGWQWRIPLQHRDGNGYVYASDFISDQDALTALEKQLAGPALSEPKLIKFTTGTRAKAWHKNVFALGLASGFLEPLESTSLYLVQSGIEVLYRHFPRRLADCAPLSKRANQLMMENQERLRDFLIAHYALNQRIGAPFWDYCRNMLLPDSLAAKLESFRLTAGLDLDDRDFFKLNSWLAILTGNQQIPGYWHPDADQYPRAALVQELENIHSAMAGAAQKAQLHSQFLLQNNCC
jgi:tryptophan halogenase